MTTPYNERKTKPVRKLGEDTRSEEEFVNEFREALQNYHKEREAGLDNLEFAVEAFRARLEEYKNDALHHGRQLEWEKLREKVANMRDNKYTEDDRESAYIEGWNDARDQVLDFSPPPPESGEQEETGENGEWCDNCGKQYYYCFYLEDESWRKVVGEENYKKSVGRWCAHCALEKLGGLEWRIEWRPNESNERNQRPPKYKHLDGSIVCSKCELTEKEGCNC